jgi:vitamin B12 transporter
MTTCRTAIIIATLAAAGVLQSAPADATSSTSSAPSSDGTSSSGNPAGADNTSADDLQQVVISATRTAQPLDKTGSSLSVISAADLETRQILVVSDALSQVPGVTISRAGGPGQVTEMYIRGAEAGQSLVLVDGIRINDPSTPDGEPILGDLLVNDIQRIEVLRGPQSTLYGSDAIGGVVNVLTQRGAGSAFAPRLDAQGGTYGTSQFNATANGTTGALDYGSAINYYDTRGISLADTGNVDTEPDGYRNVAATANLRVHAGDQISLDLRGFYIRSHTGIADYVPPDYTLQATPEYLLNSLLAGYAALNASLLDGALRQRLAIVGSDSDRRDYGIYTPLLSNPNLYQFTPAENFYAEGGATRLEYQGVLEADSADEFTYGAETELTTLSTDSLPDPSNMPTTGRDRVDGYYAQWQSTLARALTLTGGVRYDHDQEFGGHTSVKLAGAWQLFDGDTVLRANYGNGFKAPSLYQQFSQYSNPLQVLRPQTATGWEVGADQLLLERRLRASLTYFDRPERDEIDFNDCYTAGSACALRPYGYYYNVDRTHASGVEAELQARPLPTLSAWLNYTNMKAFDELTGLALARRAHISANAGLAWSAQTGTSLGASLGYVGSRFDDDADSVPLASSRTVNVYASYALSARLQVFGRVDNLLNDRSESVAGYRVLGEAFYAGIRAAL